MNKTCKDCVFWHKSYLVYGFKMPGTCNKHPFSYAKHDDAACVDFCERG